jgi:propanediol dehydratase small subunit
MSFQNAYNAIEDFVEAPSSSDVAPPFRPDASLEIRQAVVRSDAGRARSVLQQFGRAALDVPRLGELMHMVAAQRLVSDVIRAGLRTSDLSITQQRLWLQASVLADAPGDVAAMLAAKFAAGPEERLAIREKALRSQAWYNVAKGL